MEFGCPEHKGGSSRRVSAGKRRRLVRAVRDRAFLPGPSGIRVSEWFNILASAIRAEDVTPYTPGILVKWVSFTGLLVALISGLVIFSYVELLILYELWAEGEVVS